VSTTSPSIGLLAANCWLKLHAASPSTPAEAAVHTVQVQLHGTQVLLVLCTVLGLT
jgi:hypothetical protein